MKRIVTKIRSLFVCFFSLKTYSHQTYIYANEHRFDPHREDILKIIEWEKESNSTIENEEEWGPYYSREQINYARNLYHNMLIPYLQSKYLEE